MKIKLSEIYVNELDNCRGPITVQSVAGLAESIKDKTLLQPILIRPYDKQPDFKYKLVAGFRRIKACIVLGYTDIEAIIREMSDNDAYFINFAENLDRQDLSIVEEADFISRFARIGMTREEIARKIGKSIGWLQPRMYLHKLPQDVKDLAAAGIISADHIRTLYSCEDEEELWSMIRRIKVQSKRDLKKGKITLRRPAKTRQGHGLLRQKRTAADANRLIDHLLAKGAPFGLHTRCLAWISGTISDNMLGADIQTYCARMSTLFLVIEEIYCDSETPTGIIDKLEKCMTMLEALGISDTCSYTVMKNGFPEKGEFPEEEQLNV